jgi:ATP-binding cassette subfamily B protein
MKRPQTAREILASLRRIFSRLRPYFQRQRLLLAGSFVTLLLEVAFSVMEPWPIKFIFDHLFHTEHDKRFGRIAFLDGLDPTTFVAVGAVALVALSGLRALAAYANTLGFVKLGNRVLSEIRADLFQHLQRLSLSFHTKARSGDLIVRVIADIGQLNNAVINAALPLLANSLLVAAMMGVMVWVNWRLGLVAMATLPLLGLFTSNFSRKVHKAARNQRDRESEMAATAAEAVGNIKLVHALSLEPIFSRLFAQQNNASRKADVKGSKLAAALGRTIGFLIAITTAMVLWYGTRLVLAKELSPGELLVFLTYMRSAFKPVQDFAKYTGRLAKAAASGQRVLDLLDRKPKVRDRADAIPAPAFRGEVRFENVSFSYRAGHGILENICLVAMPGQHIALVGPSGAGKSTLVSLLLRLYDPTSGRVLIDGNDLLSYTLATLRPQISVVLQETLLFAASVWDNIGYGEPNATRSDIEAAARLANAHEFILALPEGYDTVLGERGVTLSGGQRQRLAIARAMLRKAPILVLDEPTTGLDHENEDQVLEALRRLAQGRTTFMISHDLSLAVRADRILFFEQGRIVEEGSHAQLIEAGGRYASLYFQQSATQQHTGPGFFSPVLSKSDLQVNPSSNGAGSPTPREDAGMENPVEMSVSFGPSNARSR